MNAGVCVDGRSTHLRYLRLLPPFVREGPHEDAHDDCERQPERDADHEEDRPAEDSPARLHCRLFYAYRLGRVRSVTSSSGSAE